MAETIDPRAGVGTRIDWHAFRAARAIRAGGIAVHATETVLGLAASAFRPDAIERVRALKSRPLSHHFLVIARDLDQIRGLVSLQTPYLAEILESWPGPYTWRLPAAVSAPTWLIDSEGCLAVRMTSHPRSSRICELAGPLISTSANRTGHPVHRSLVAARRDFGALVDIYVPGPLATGAGPSRIRDGITGDVIRG